MNDYGLSSSGVGTGQWAGPIPDVELSATERELIEALANFIVEPGTRCPTCHRRRNKKRQEDSPAVREVRFRGPSDRVDAAEEGLDALQEFTGVDPYSYPRIELLEKLLALGAQHREELRSYFKDEA